MEDEHKFFEDFEIGDSYETGGRTITETDIVFHAMHSGDFMPHHTDAAWCATQPFKKPFAHGNMTFSISTGLCLQSEGLNPNGMSYGYNKIRYPNLVFAGDTIRVRVTVKSKEDSPKDPSYGLIIEAKETLNQNDEVVCYAEHVLYVKKKNP
ncbi:dehydratase [Seongchinamella unica]|uniref:Dehydratase n=1 Tax=Seongchinamella unica TaxID=2547392 RepID=A0A4R5LNC3_9GAMM|nr:MaoC/PaaZ C-terminal domain-containing protein [Seongchinamella unica]TDG11842.1 dehydratase [Seongchinamella unica]